MSSHNHAGLRRIFINRSAYTHWYRLGMWTLFHIALGYAALGLIGAVIAMLASRAPATQNT